MLMQARDGEKDDDVGVTMTVFPLQEARMRDD